MTFKEWFNEVTKPGWHGTVRAMLSHHPEKFSKKACKKGGDKGKLCPWAIAASMDDEDAEPHYKDQESSLKGEPHKKKKFKDED
jgi:hypothetical protein